VVDDDDDYGDKSVNNDTLVSLNVSVALFHGASHHFTAQ
jgi:hypothetical protein